MTGKQITTWALFFGLAVSGAVYGAQSPTAPAQQREPARGQTIFDYKGELKMTDKQEGEIRTILTNLSRDQRLTNARVVLLDAELEDLINKEADLDQIRKKFRERSELQINLRVSDLEATRKINRVLSPDQLKRWRSIQESARAQPR